MSNRRDVGKLAVDRQFSTFLNCVTNINSVMAFAAGQVSQIPPHRHVAYVRRL